MILLILIPLLIAAYITGFLFTARMLFRGYRLHEAQKRACPQRQKRYHRDDCAECRNDVLWWQDRGARATVPDSDGDLLLISCLCALGWPVGLPATAAIRFVKRDAPLAPREKEAQMKALEAENERLSKEIDKLHKS